MLVVYFSCNLCWVGCNTSDENLLKLAIKNFTPLWCDWWRNKWMKEWTKDMDKVFAFSKKKKKRSDASCSPHLSEQMTSPPLQPLVPFSRPPVLRPPSVLSCYWAYKNSNRASGLLRSEDKEQTGVLSLPVNTDLRGLWNGYVCVGGGLSLAAVSRLWFGAELLIFHLLRFQIKKWNTFLKVIVKYARLYIGSMISLYKIFNNHNM